MKKINTNLKFSVGWLVLVLLLILGTFAWRLTAGDRKSIIIINESGEIEETILKKDSAGNYRPKRTIIHHNGEDAEYGGDPAHPREVGRVKVRTGKTKSESPGPVPPYGN